MQQLNSIRKCDLTVFENKKILIYGERGNPTDLYRIFRALKFNVLGCCIEKHKNKRQIIKDNIRGIKIIKVEKIKEIVEINDDVIIQSIGFESSEIKRISNIADCLNVEFSSFLSGELLNNFRNLIDFNIFDNYFYFWLKKIRYKQNLICKDTLEWKMFRNDKNIQQLIICSPPKTADFTLEYTISQANEKLLSKDDFESIRFINLYHKPSLMKKMEYGNKDGKIKVIMGIREPISQNISDLFQQISQGIDYSRWMFGYMENRGYKEKKNVVNLFKQELLENKNDIQKLWDINSKLYLECDTPHRRKYDYNGFIQLFIPLFEKYAVDILKYPFDKEKGYTIIKEGKIEVFVYQLEKLNSVIEELSHWIEVPFDNLVRGNVAEDKWIGKLYSQAKEEIEISYEYFEHCYQEPYVQHCYSLEDIEKFKKRWKKNVRCHDLSISD